MADSNRHAYVVPVILEPHPDPETTRLSVVRVKGYTCVCNTEDWQGIDKAIYIQPDTVVPDTEEFAFLKVNRAARKKLDEEKASLTSEEYDARLKYIEELEAINISKLRITAVRLRGVQSFGMLWPITAEDTRLNGLQIGDDAWDLMGFKRYDPPPPAHAGGDDILPPDLPWLYDYDVENFFNFPDVFKEGEEVVATEKLDGANIRFTYAKSRETGEYQMFVGSREVWKADKQGNMFWMAFRANPWLEEFCKAHPDWVVYGEVFGNVQKLKYDVKPNEPNKVRIFDVLKVNEFMSYDEREQHFTEAQRVPIVYRGVWDVEKLKELSRGKSTLASNIREGVVMEPVVGRNDLSLGRVKVKIVSFDYLSKG